LSSGLIGARAATLSDEERRKMQKSMEIAVVRSVLLRREKAVIRLVETRAPKLLK
jgi:hypothetical protein